MNLSKITQGLLAGALLMGFSGLSRADLVPTTSFAFSFPGFTSTFLSGDVGGGGAENAFDATTDFYGFTLSGAGSATGSGIFVNISAGTVVPGTLSIWEDTNSIAGLDTATDTLLGTSSGMISLLAIGGLSSGPSYFLTLSSATPFAGYSGSLTVTEGGPVIPLPGAALLFGSALLGVGGLGRKKKSLSQGMAA
jgi:hypothetical protein